GPTKAMQVYANPVPNKQYTPPPASFYQYQSLDTERTTATDIQVTYIGAWSNEAKSAFEYAASIWESQIDSSVPIKIQVEFSTLPSGVLGGAGWTSLHRDFSGAPVTSTWYPASLANALSQSDRNGSTVSEIGAEFAVNASWYFGTDGNTPSNKFDFVTVVLHEIGHGLGFSDSMDVNGSIGSWGYTSGGTFPIIYDRFVDNGGGTLLIDGFPNNSAALASQLTSNNLYFDGTNANSANGGQVRLYAPNPWEQGSSIAHLNLTTFLGTPNSLMTPAVSPGEAQHNPGSITLGILQDMGWQLMNEAPVISDLPVIFVQSGSNKDNAIDLWQYVNDADSSDSELTYKIIAESNSDAGATIDSNRFLDINPVPVNWEGRTTLTIEITDPDNHSSQASVTVISGDISTVYLPFTAR
ncbi:MAG: hypothetical protein DWQ04_08790, partial [Chloroflexi bacterium]